MNKKKLFIIISGVAVLLVIIIIFIATRPSTEEKNLAKELEAEEIDVTKVRIKDKEVTINYDQPLDLADEEAELFATWAYILGIATEQAPEAETIIVNCRFEDKEKVKITAEASAIKAFLAKEISAVEFLQKIKAEALTKGPEM